MESERSVTRARRRVRLWVALTTQTPGVWRAPWACGQGGHVMNDTEVVVLDPEDREVAGDAPAPEHYRATLTRLIDHSHQALLASPTMQQYLQSVGVPDAAVWSAFRLGAGHASLAVGLEPAAWAALDEVGLVHGLHKSLTLARADGLNLPTYDPADPDQVIGVIRLTQAQNKHVFATPPRGIACGA
jgi:hypothetical protein